MAQFCLCPCIRGIPLIGPHRTKLIGHIHSIGVKRNAHIGSDIPAQIASTIRNKRRQPSSIVIGVQIGRGRPLPETRGAGRDLGLRLRPGQGRQQHRRQHRQRGDDHQQFDHSKGRGHEVRSAGLDDALPRRLQIRLLMIGVFMFDFSRLGLNKTNSSRCQNRRPSFAME